MQIWSIPGIHEEYTRSSRISKFIHIQKYLSGLLFFLPSSKSLAAFPGHIFSFSVDSVLKKEREMLGREAVSQAGGGRGVHVGGFWACLQLWAAPHTWWNHPMQLSHTSPPSYHPHHFLYMHPIYSLTAEVTNVKFKNAKGLRSFSPWRAYIRSQLQTRMIPSVEVRTPREGCWWKHSVRWTWGERREAGREAAERKVCTRHRRTHPRRGMGRAELRVQEVRGCHKLGWVVQPKSRAAFQSQPWIPESLWKVVAERKDAGILGLRRRRIQSGARDEAWSLRAFV